MKGCGEWDREVRYMGARYMWQCGSTNDGPGIVEDLMQVGGQRQVCDEADAGVGWRDEGLR